MCSYLQVAPTSPPNVTLRPALSLPRAATVPGKYNQTLKFIHEIILLAEDIAFKERSTTFSHIFKFNLFQVQKYA